MFGTGSKELPADACVRCGSISIIRRGYTGSGNQCWYCKDCKRTFTANVGRVLGMSKLPVETWMTYVEAFVDRLPLRDCMDKCGVGLCTAWFMRRRIIECIQRYNPSFNAVAGDRVEIDETYFHDSYKGYHKGTMPRPARKSGRKVTKRGLSKQQVCVVTDKAGAYPRRPRTPRGGAANARTRPRTPSTASTACTPGSKTSCTASRAFPRSTASHTSHGSNGRRRSRAGPPSSGAPSDVRSATACTGSRAACMCACPCPCDGR